MCHASNPALPGQDAAALRAAAAWETSPCRVCAQAPCCRLVPLREFDPDTRADFAALEWLLGFREIELALKDDGTWIILYRAACSFLDTVTNQCPIHDQADQPAICKRYAGATCWYRKVFFTPHNHLLIRFDQPRLRAWLELCTFDGEGVLKRAPAWDQACAVLDTLPLRNHPTDHRLPPGPGAVRLAMPPGAPATLEGWEFVKFRLGFPGLNFMLESGRGWFEALVTPWPDCPRDPSEPGAAPWTNPDVVASPPRAWHPWPAQLPEPPRRGTRLVLARTHLAAAAEACRADSSGRILSLPG